jgi:hypothetical protein
MDITRNSSPSDETFKLSLVPPGGHWFYTINSGLFIYSFIYLLTYLLKYTEFKLLVQRMKLGADQNLKILTVQYPW